MRRCMPPRPHPPLRAQQAAPRRRARALEPLHHTTFLLHRYILDSGMIDVLVAAEVVHTVRAGDFFGEIALLTRERRTASCRAATFCELWTLSRADLDLVLADYPELAARLQHELWDS